MSSITFDIVGNPELYNSDDENYENAAELDQGLHFYTLDKLPGNVAICRVHYGEDIWTYLHYHFEFVTKEKLTEFVSSMKNKTEYSLKFRPGSNQFMSIDSNGVDLIFRFDGTGGDEPGKFAVVVPCECCIEAFEKLLG